MVLSLLLSMETPSLNSLYIAIAVLALFLVVVFFVCLKLIGQDQNHNPYLQPDDEAIRVESVEVFSPGYESITAVLRSPTTYSQAHQMTSECLER